MNTCARTHTLTLNGEISEFYHFLHNVYIIISGLCILTLAITHVDFVFPVHTAQIIADLHSQEGKTLL